MRCSLPARRAACTPAADAALAHQRHRGCRCRFELDGEAVRIPYWLAPGRRIVLLAVFRKTKMHEVAEVERAHQAQKVCEAEHGHAQHTYERRKES